MDASWDRKTVQFKKKTLTPNEFAAGTAIGCIVMKMKIPYSLASMRTKRINHLYGVTLYPIPMSHVFTPFAFCC